jgi:hypothetical protein
MKKTAIILAIIAAFVATSCQKPFEPSILLAVDNFKLDLPKTTNNINGNIHYHRITSTGPWEATLETEKVGEIWCWLEDYYLQAKKDAHGVVLKDEMGNTIYDKVYVAKGIETFEGSEKFCRVSGSGTTFLPMGYMDNIGSARYATFTVRRTDMDLQCETYITQVK